MGGTYGGNSVCCAAATAVLDVFQEEDILSNVMTCEGIVRARLEEVDDVTARRVIREVRGRGLMIGTHGRTLIVSCHIVSPYILISVCTHDISFHQHCPSYPLTLFP